MWTIEVAGAQARLESTLRVRGKELPKQQVWVQPWLGVEWHSTKATADTPRLAFDKPVLFENRTYEFEIRCKGLKHAHVEHRSRRIEDAFRFDGTILRGSVNFGNDVGWFLVDIVTTDRHDVTRRYSVGLEVHATKLDMAEDMERLVSEISSTYPLWQYSFGRATVHGAERTRVGEHQFPLVWLEQFKSLWKDLDQQVRHVLNAPHHRLQSSQSTRRIEQLRGKLSPALEEVAAGAIATDESARKVRRTSRNLSVDTPENRFVKGLLDVCARELRRIDAKLARIAVSPTASISESARKEVRAWSDSIEGLRAHSLWKAVGRFKALQKESLVLHQRSGYSGVYRIWQQLRMYLQVIGNHTTISTKALSELYEVWCFIEMRRLLEALGFRETEARRANIDYSGLEAQLAEDGLGAAFRFERGSRESNSLVSLRLAHEPVIRASQRNGSSRHLVSWLNTQKPDIVVEATFPDESRLLWVFDAKYRIHRHEEASVDDEGIESAVAETVDLVPSEALNQMHRYRDAILLRQSGESVQPLLTRPVIGAYCLYPGWFPDQKPEQSGNPYDEVVNQIGVGAFPLLPGQESVWLREFLATQLGTAEDPSVRSPGPEWQLSRWSSRIGPTGLQLRGERNLVFVAKIGPKRSATYIQKFRDGHAKWFHVQDKALRRGDIAASALADVRHCAVALEREGESGSFITHLYTVLSVKLVERSAISEAQAGTATPGSTEMYWLFELGESEALPTPVSYRSGVRYRAWLTSVDVFRKKI